MTDIADITVRSATLDDLDTIDGIEQDAGFNPRSISQLQYSIQNHGVWLLLRGETMAGFAVCQTVLDEAELLNIVIAADQQGKRLGYRLLSHCLQLLHKQGMVTCLLEVGEGNSAAQALYKTLGFRAIGVRKNYYQLASGKQDALIYQYHFTSQV